MPASTKRKAARRPPARRGKSKPPRIEIYTDERVAEFLLTNTVDSEDYARAVKLVRRMGLDPARIDHDKPVGVR